MIRQSNPGGSAAAQDSAKHVLLRLRGHSGEGTAAFRTFVLSLLPRCLALKDGITSALNGRRIAAQFKAAVKTLEANVAYTDARRILTHPVARARANTSSPAGILQSIAFANYLTADSTLLADW